MQIFLPYPDVLASAKVLDRQRLGKQRVEAKQILEINLKVALRNSPTWEGAEWGKFGEKIPWENQPAVRMMRGWEIFNCFYGWIMCGQWIARGYQDNLRPFFAKTALELNPHIMAYFHDGFLPSEYLPTWLYREEFHLSHRANLLAKKGMFDNYVGYFGQIENYQEIPYEWNRTFWK